MGNQLFQTNRQNRRVNHLQSRSSLQQASTSTYSTNTTTYGSTHQDPPLSSSLTRNDHGDAFTYPSHTTRPKQHCEDGEITQDHASFDTEGYRALLTCHNKLVIALTMDYLTIAGVLLSRGFISDEIFAKMLLTSLTPNEKATILVMTVRERINISPQKFSELTKILSEHDSTKDIVQTLQQSANQGNVTPRDFNSYLKTLYVNVTPIQVSADTWPPSATRKVIKLAMIKATEVRRGQIKDEFVRQTITGKVDDILQEKYPIELKDIFNKTEGTRKVILLEGAPGCGKTTLSVHISQKWGEGKLFTEFKYVILVRLRDPAVQAASCIADLLPARDDEMRQQAANIISANDGEGVLFILDGWDELPSTLRKNSIFREMIQAASLQNSSLIKSTIIVTSRPITSGDLNRCASARIEILGFTPGELKNYFIECLNGDSMAVETLLERIHENPAVAGSCYLPMNANILMHLFIDGNNTLPTTQHGIFSELVLSCIYRHHNERTQLKDLSLKSLQQIPEAIREPFLFLCELAYQGIMDDKVIFNSLPSDVNTLGLLQGVESYVRRGKEVSYNFLHLSIQEILAGFYIATQLPNDEQVTKFNELFDESRFSAVFQFYAAITKLQTPGIKDVVIRVAKYHSKTLLLSLLHCLYEAQDPSLCECVAEFQDGLDLSGTTLTPSDCLCIGYFLSSVCKMSTGKFKVNFKACSIGDQGCKYLVRCLDTLLGVRNTEITLLTMNLHNNVITHCGACHLSTLFKVGCIEELVLGPQYLDELVQLISFHSGGSIGNKIESLQGTFVEELKSNHTLTSLDLNKCGLTSLCAKSLAEALATNKHLVELDISNNTQLGDDGIQHLALALKVNRSLKKLDLQKCSITSLSKSFTQALTSNTHLKELNISNNALGGDSIQHLAQGLGVNRCLKQLNLCNCGIASLSEKFAKALATNTHLEELNISENALGGDSIQHLAHALSVNRCLKQLNLHMCGITSLNENFAKAFATNTHLKELTISDNVLGDNGVQYLAHALKVNRCLEKLDLSNCRFTSQGAKSLAEALETNKHLEELSISINVLGDDGIQNLADALQINHQLKKLKLVSCGITDTGLQYLAEAIQDNHSLKIIIVHNSRGERKNKITEKIIPVIIECLQNNHTLTELYLPTNLKSSISSIQKAINETRKRNGLPLIKVIGL